ncbi:DUF1684 domain-containing protein [Streptomyces puniciscabiei]|uniref:DUF1684 domain-containing protein n=1 Tax=Streptomyces puniciscabiei TaxID=164348 RepID=UPI003329F936
MTTEATTTDRQAFTENWLEWYRAQEVRLAAPHGFLAITGLHWLDGRPQRLPDAPGAWHTGPDGVVAGTPVHGEHHFGVLPERGSVDAVWEDAAIEVARRGGHDIVRPRHPGAPLRTAFTGTPAYAPDPRWAVTGRCIPFGTPRPTTVSAAVEGLEHVYDAPGRVEFELDGQQLSRRPASSSSTSPPSRCSPRSTRPRPTFRLTGGVRRRGHRAGAVAAGAAAAGGRVSGRARTRAALDAAPR